VTRLKGRANGGNFVRKGVNKAQVAKHLTVKPKHKHEHTFLSDQALTARARPCAGSGG